MLKFLFALLLVANIAVFVAGQADEVRNILKRNYIIFKNSHKTFKNNHILVYSR